MAEYSQKWHNGKSSRTRSTKTSNELVAIQAQLKNLGREIKKVNEKVYAAQEQYSDLAETMIWRMHSNISRILELFCHELKKLIAHFIPMSTMIGDLVARGIASIATSSSGTIYICFFISASS
ncbi:hypothetical protein Tco_0940395 [Tanacetum coccineum]|uniref:Uncharacterized protein n=1 Tax=Tanacetum coccineum TaxID=301880 RepID=A0ABQ5DMW7_9ASTR